MSLRIEHVEHVGTSHVREPRKFGRRGRETADDARGPARGARVWGTPNLAARVDADASMSRRTAMRAARRAAEAEADEAAAEEDELLLGCI